MAHFLFNCNLHHYTDVTGCLALFAPYFFAFLSFYRGNLALLPPYFWLLLRFLGDSSLCAPPILGFFLFLRGFFRLSPSNLTILFPGWGGLQFPTHPAYDFCYLDGVVCCLLPIQFTTFALRMGWFTISYPSGSRLLLPGWGGLLFLTHPAHIFCFLDGIAHC